MIPAIVTQQLNLGINNSDLARATERLTKGQTYRDLSTIIVCPTRGIISDRVVQSWMALIRPMNQKVIGPLFFRGYEVGAAYSMAVQMILESPELSQWQYLCTLEEDNLPPPDGLMKLYEAIEGGVDGVRYDGVGGLYWTKGEGGQPMIYGDPVLEPLNFIPQVPKPDTVQEANGIGMGFSLFRISMFKDSRLPKPPFVTKQDYLPESGSRLYTQDLYFCEHARKLGFRFACDTRIKVGHFDASSDVIW